MSIGAGIVLNAVLFQCVWFATVAGAGYGLWWTGLPVLLVFALWQLRTSRWPRATLIYCGTPASVLNSQPNWLG